MNLIGTFDERLVGKILDPIHGVIRITELEKKIIDHPLFQRLRNIRQNTFLYKVFPSAVHSRFEHSIGVMHLSYEILKNLALNTSRYKKKEYEQGSLYTNINKISDKDIQNLRLAALLHDIGHGPLAHQFDDFSLTKKVLNEHTDEDERFKKILNLCQKERLDHEHISCIFIISIIKDLQLDNEVSIDSIIKIIEQEYEFEYPKDESGVNIHNLFTSIISSCPIDADRMDYLLRDSYFSGVKYGLYDYSRLLMSIVPFEEENKVYLAFKESGLDTLIEFINARSNLFSQVYFHKTNRFFSSALKESCKNVQSEIIETDKDTKIIDSLKSFYLKNSDNYFIENTLPKSLKSLNKSNELELVNDIIKRNVWKKVFERKYTFSNMKLEMNDVGDFSKFIKEKINTFLENEKYSKNNFIIDVITENNFKDIVKSKAKLLKKQADDSYELEDFIQSKRQLQPHHRIRYFIRVYEKPNEYISNTKSKLKDISSSIDMKYNEIEMNLK